MIEEAASGVLGPVPPQVLLAGVEELWPDTSTSVRSVTGEREHHAVVDDDTDISWAEELARHLSLRHPGHFYAFAALPDYYWLIEIENGRDLFNDEGAIDGIARELGCPVAEP